MRVTQAFRFELDPNRAARVALAKHVGAARFACRRWNEASPFPPQPSSTRNGTAGSGSTPLW